MRPGRPGEVADQPRADHRAVGLVQVVAERVDRLVRRCRRPPSARRCRPGRIRAPRVAPPSRWSPPRHSTSSTTSPRSETHCASAPSAIAARSCAGESLTPVGSRAAMRSTNPRDGLYAAAPTASGVGVAGGAPGRIDPGGVDPARSVASASSTTHLRLRERGEVVLREDGRDGVPLDGPHPQPDGGDRQRVPADPAAEVRDHGRRRGAEPGGVPGGDVEPRGLLQPGAGEQHPVGELAELRARPAPQRRLRQDRGGLLGGEALAPQRRRPGEHVGGGRGPALVVHGRSTRGSSSTSSSLRSMRPP